MAKTLLLFFILYIGLNAQNCNLEDNIDYDNGYLVMLYDIQSAADCCTSCSTFEECTYFSWVKDPAAGEWYKRCFIKDTGTNRKTNQATVAGHVKTPPPPPSSCNNIENNTDYNNGWITLLENVPSSESCCEACGYYPGCNYWSWIEDPKAGAWYRRCFFKSSNSPKVPNNGTVVGSAKPIPPGPPRSGKRGLAWFNSKSCSDLKLMKGVSWLYNWSPTPDPEIMPCIEQLGMEFIPMQWGGGGIQDLSQVIYGHTSHLLAFNEPNFHSQSNVDPADAAKLWPQLEAVAKAHGLKLSSPAASACGPNPATDCWGASWSPVPWFDAFFGNCTGCQVDFIATHIYTCDIQQFTEYLDSLKKYNKKIWLTEFACPAAGKPESFEIDFMKQALNLLDNDPQIERYSWFGTRIDPTDNWLGPQVDLLSDSDCSLTDLGKLYTS